MIHVKRSDLGYIEVHKDSYWLATIEYLEGTYGIQVWDNNYDEWFEHGTYATLREAHTKIKELI